MITKIVSVKEINGETFVELSESPFRESSGGQPCDYGTLEGDDFEAEVYDVISPQEVKVKSVSGKVVVGEVDAEIDSFRRSMLTRMHTAEHIFFRSLQMMLPALELDKIRLDEDSSTLTVFAEDVSWDDVFSAEEMANAIIAEDRPIKEHTVPKSEVCCRFPELRIKIDRIHEEHVRVIEVYEHDFSACSGTHCKSTKEVGGFIVTKLNSAGPGRFEIGFKVDIMAELFEYSGVARKISSVLGTELDKIEPTIVNMRESLERFKRMAREVKVESNSEDINGINFVYSEAEMEPKQLMRQVSEMLKPKTVVCFINRTEKSPQVMIAVSEDLPYDASSMINKVCERFGGKGGGRKNFATGSIETIIFKEVLGLVREMLN